MNHSVIIKYELSKLLRDSINSNPNILLSVLRTINRNINTRHAHYRSLKHRILSLRARIISCNKINVKHESKRTKYINILNNLRAQLNIPPFEDVPQPVSNFGLHNLPTKIKKMQWRKISCFNIQCEINHLRRRIANNYVIEHNENSDQTKETVQNENVVEETVYTINSFYDGISTHERLQKLIDFCKINIDSFDWFVNSVFVTMSRKQLIEKIENFYGIYNITGNILHKTSWLNLCREYFMFITIGSK